MADDNSRDIMINLDAERDAYVVSRPDDIIHLDEFARIRDLLKDSLDVAKTYAKRKRSGGDSQGRSDNCRDKKENCGSDLMRVRRHDTIMLAGVRGSGKTTFMLSLLYFIKTGQVGIKSDGSKHEECEIESLHILDPTLIEDKTHIFINIISMIKDKVDERAKKANCFKDEECDLSRKYKKWDKSFRKLAEGVPSIDGLGPDGFKTDSWLDAEYVMNKGVRMAHAANKLEESFHEFVSCSLEFIDKKAFILCFDDIDTNFKRGWPVLEVLHKYLTTPQLITILSGDPSLYSILIRDNQWSNFSNRLLKIEAEKSSENLQRYTETVAHLEEQYFLKLLKPERRVFLNNLYQIEQQRTSKSIKLSYNVNGTETIDEMKITYSRLFDKFGVGRSERSHSYRFLLSLPLRSQKQLLYAFVKQENLQEGPVVRDLLEDIIDIFWSDLTVKKVDVSSLRNNPQNISIHILNYLVLNGIINEGYTLNQYFNEPLTNSAQFVLGAILHEQVIEDPSQVFEYWMRVCVARELGVLMGDRVVSRGEGPSLQNLIDHCALNQSRVTPYLSRFCTAYLRAYKGFDNKSKVFNQKKYSVGTWHGTLPLYAFAGKARQSAELSKNRIDYVLNKRSVSLLMKIAGSLPLSGSTDHYNKSLPVYSIYNIFGNISQIISSSIVNRKNLNVAATEVLNILYTNAQFREYPLPNWASLNSADPVEEEDSYLYDKDPHDAALELFAKKMVFWSVVAHDKNISASLLGKIFTRLFYALNNLDNQFSSNLLGDWLHRMVVIFLNSVVIVEAMEQFEDLSKLGLQLTNPITVDVVFVNNLEKLTAGNYHIDNTALTFSKWILACPIWDLYLNDGKLKDRIACFRQKYVDDMIPYNNIVSDLKFVDWKQYNLCDLLNSNNVQVRNFDTFSHDIIVPTEGANKPHKPVFNINNKSKLIQAFVDAGISVTTIRDMPDDKLLDILKSSNLGSMYDFTPSNVRSIKARIAKGTLKWP